MERVRIPYPIALAPMVLTACSPVTGKGSRLVAASSFVVVEVDAIHAVARLTGPLQ